MPVKKTKKICLIQPPPSFKNADCCLPSEYVGIGLLALSAFLEQHHFKTKIVHFPIALSQGYSAIRIFQEIAAFNPDLFAIGMNWVHFSSGAIETAEKLKTLFPNIPVVAGGQHASLFAADISRDFMDCIDALIIGEAEIPLLRICENLSSSATVPDGIPGIVARGSTGNFSCGELLNDIDTLPFQTFARLWPGYDRATAAVSTMRGACPMDCAYCLEGGSLIKWKRKPAKLHSPEYIFEQMNRFMAEGKSIITIEDQFSLRGDKGAEELAALFEGADLKPAELNIFSEPASFTSSGLDALAAITPHTVSIDYGIETGSQRVASTSGISFKTSNFLAQIQAATTAGILPFTWWMIGFPHEGPAELKETRDFIIETMAAGAIPRWVTPLILFPQTQFMANAEYYNIKPLMTSFKNFLRFSFQPKDKFGYYPKLSTHGTNLMTGEMIAKEAVSIKNLIVDNWRLIDDFYNKRTKLKEKYFDRTKMLSQDKEAIFSTESFF